MEFSSSTLSARQRTSFEFEDGRNLCKCGDLQVLWTSWTQENPGRRVYVCRNYSPAKERYCKKGCNHFSWYDCEMCERAKEVINGIKAGNHFSWYNLNSYTEVIFLLKLMLWLKL